jgi:hypothetical protein
MALKRAPRRNTKEKPPPTIFTPLSREPSGQRREKGTSCDVSRGWRGLSTTFPNSVQTAYSEREGGGRNRSVPPSQELKPSLSPPLKRGSVRDQIDGGYKPPKAAGNQALSDLRNQERLEQANKKDSKLIGKYLPLSVSSLFSEVVQGPDDSFVPPSWLLEAVREVALAETPTPGSPAARFNISFESLEFNSGLIESYGNDFESFLADQGGTTMHYGSEFRPINQLERVLGPHPNFGFFRSILASGMPYHFTRELSEEKRVTEIKLQLARGNHKLGKEKESVAASLLLKYRIPRFLYAFTCGQGTGHQRYDGRALWYNESVQTSARRVEGVGRQTDPRPLIFYVER